jgi:hypothetical protein
MNKFLVQINNILNNTSLPRHNVAADRALPEDLPPDLWAADRVWVRRCSHVPPLTPLYDGPYTVLQRSLRAFKLQIGAKEDQVSTSRLKPCSSSTPTASPPTRGRPRLHTADPPPPPRRERRWVRFHLTPQPATADSGTVFPAQPGRFFAHPEEATKSRTSADNAGRPPTSLTASCPLTATKKLEAPMWRAAHLCGQLHVLFINKTSSNIVDTLVLCDPNMYSHLCTEIYSTSVYSLLSTNSFACMFRVLL